MWEYKLPVSYGTEYRWRWLLPDLCWAALQCWHQYCSIFLAWVAKTHVVMCRLNNFVLLGFYNLHPSTVILRAIYHAHQILISQLVFFLIRKFASMKIQLESFWSIHRHTGGGKRKTINNMAPICKQAMKRQKTSWISYCTSLQISNIAINNIVSVRIIKCL